MTNEITAYESERVCCPCELCIVTLLVLYTVYMYVCMYGSNDHIETVCVFVWIEEPHSYQPCISQCCCALCSTVYYTCERILHMICQVHRTHTHHTHTPHTPYTGLIERNAEKAGYTKHKLITTRIITIYISFGWCVNFWTETRCAYNRHAWLALCQSRSVKRC